MKRFDGGSAEAFWRRFIPVGSGEDLNRLDSLMKEKDLTREDLVTVLRAIKLNPRCVK